MKEKYIKAYGNQYELGSPNSRVLTALFRRVCSRHGILHDKKIFEYLNTFEQKQADVQLSLFD